jgi:hypothetical protein
MRSAIENPSIVRPLLFFLSLSPLCISILVPASPSMNGAIVHQQDSVNLDQTMTDSSPWVETKTYKNNPLKNP